MSVLIIDDEKEILETLKRHFDLEGIDVTVATNPKEALKLMSSNPFPVVLTDIRMPEMSGVEVIRKAKGINPTSIIYVMTAYASMVNMVECLELGAADYFIKPFQNMDFVIQTVKDALARHRRWQQDIVGVRKARE